MKARVCTNMTHKREESPTEKRFNNKKKHENQNKNIKNCT